MKLYHCPGTCSGAPHIVLEELAIPFELNEISLKKGEGQSSEYKLINPTGGVPLLEIAPGDRLREVQVILQYLADQHLLACMKRMEARPAVRRVLEKEEARVGS